MKESFPYTLDDIRKFRDKKAEKHTDQSGRIDWHGVVEETNINAMPVLEKLAALHRDE